MRIPKQRRLVNATVLLLGIGAICLWVMWLDAGMWRTAYATGYALYGVLFFLTLFNARKKLPGLPLGSGRFWMQLHVYLGAGTLPLFLLHTGGRWPDGWLEATLAFFFAGTYLSGLLGLYLTRTLPTRLSRTGEQFIFERIPALRHAVRVEARNVVLRAVDESGATTLADYYADRLFGFFTRPRSFAYALRPNSSTKQRLFNELTGMRRFLTEPERDACERLFALVRKKDDLDFHRSQQGLLKGWLFIHLALTAGLMLIGLAHGLLASAYQGGIG